MAKHTPPAGSKTYWLPNLLTAFNLICGILAILLAMEYYASGFGARAQDYTPCAWLLLAAVVFDFLDGKVARWTNTVSDFGVKIDSLSDFVSFGIGPAVLAYAALLSETDGWLKAAACFVFLLAGAFRLARFNLESESGGVSQHFFKGLPIPAASATLCTIVLVGAEPTLAGGPKSLGRSFVSMPPELSGTLAAVLMLALAALMVSRIPFPAFKHLDRRNLILLGGIAIFFAVLSLILPLGNILFLMMLLYLLIGLFQYSLDRVIRQHQRGKTYTGA